VTTPLFVVGCHRSGTSVLRRILSTHPEIWLAKETQYLAFRDWGPGDWHNLRTVAELDEHFAFLLPFLAPTGWTQVPRREAFQASGEPATFASVYRWVCQLEAPTERALRYWGDNTPRYVSMVPELNRAWPEARFLHLVRDPRDVVRSTLQVWFGGNTALTAAEEWVERVGAGLAAQQRVGERLKVVRFEDLVTDPAGTLADVARWLGVPDTFDPNDPGADGVAVSAQHHLARVAQPLDPAVIGRWREFLTEEQVDDIEQLCQPFLRAFDYELSTWRASWNPTPRLGRYATEYARSWSINVGRGLRRRLTPVAAHSRSSR
jgi:Sulfotransferase family